MKKSKIFCLSIIFLSIAIAFSASLWAIRFATGVIAGQNKEKYFHKVSLEKSSFVGHISKIKGGYLYILLDSVDWDFCLPKEYIPAYTLVREENKMYIRLNMKRLSISSPVLGEKVRKKKGAIAIEWNGTQVPLI